MARTSGGSEQQALAGMARVGAPRQPMGSAPIQARNASAQATTGGTLRPRNNSKDSNATSPGTNTHRSNVSAESNGACYAIKTSIHPVGPIEASSTQANGRIFRSATNRSATSEFDAGVASVRGR